MATIKTKELKPYSEYKDSGVDWLGDVPKEWKIDRIKWTVSCCRNGIWGGEPDGSNDLICIRVADFDRTRFRVKLDEPTIRSITPSERKDRLLNNGDLLLEKSGGGEKQPVGTVMLYNHNMEAVCSNFIARMPVVNGFNANFLVYIHAHLYSGRVNVRSIKQTTGIQNLDAMAYLNELIAYPSTAEQQAIVDFLDRRTGEIDDVITKKERLIELLREKRTALISRAVTKGLNPDTEMKDSGIDWLGKVPKHWEVKRLKRCVELINQKTDKPKLPYIGLENIESWTGYLIGDIEAYQPEGASNLFTSSDILFGKLRPYLAKVLAPEVKGRCSSELIVLRPKKVNREYLFYYCLSDAFVRIADSSTFGAKMPRADWRFIGMMVIPRAPIHEQKEIVSFLDSETAKLDKLISKNQQLIDKLQEKRTALISAAVTGKIDVRSEVKLSQAKQRANPYFRRTVLATEIVHRLHEEPTFGRVKFQKILYMCEHHLGIDLQGNYKRDAAGPFDNNMLRSVCSQMARQKWYQGIQNDQGTRYIAMENAGRHSKYFDRYWQEYHNDFDNLIEAFRKLNTKRCEIITTLYAAWNDLILRSDVFDDNDIINEVLTNWHDSKAEISKKRWQNALGWMKQKGLVPRGLGKETTIKK